MRFIHTADWHVGGSSFLPDHLERSEQVIRSIYDLAKSKDIFTIVMAGDVFEDSDTTREQRDLVERLLLEYDSAGFTTLVIPGNHDIIDRAGTKTALSYLSLLTINNRFFNSVVTETTKLHIIDDVAFLLLCHRPKHFKEDAEVAIQNVIKRGGYSKLVVVAHELIKGSVLDNNFKMETGAVVPSLPIDFFALGDIHLCQKMSPIAYYSGAPYQLKFGDSDKKGVFVVDTDQDKIVPEFVEIPSKKFVIIRTLNKEEIPEDCYVKVVTADPEISNIELPDNVVKKEFVRDVELAISLDSGAGLKDNLVSGVKQQLESDENVMELMSIAEIEIESLLAEV